MPLDGDRVVFLEDGLLLLLVLPLPLPLPLPLGGLLQERYLWGALKERLLFVLPLPFPFPLPRPRPLPLPKPLPRFSGG